MSGQGTFLGCLNAGCLVILLVLSILFIWFVVAMASAG